MATVIDALVVTLGLDPKNFTAEQKKAVEGLKAVDAAATQAAQKETKRTATKQGENQRVERTAEKERADRAKREKDELREKAKVEAQAAKQRAEALTVAKEAALGFGAALAAIATDKFLVGTASTVAATGRLAHNLDLSTQQVSAFGLAVSQSIGGSAEDAIGSLAALSSALVKLSTGQDKGILTLFQRLTFYDPKHQAFQTIGPDGKPLSSLDMMGQIAERGQRTDPKLFAQALSESGFSSEVISYLEKGPGFDQKAYNDALSRAPSDKEAEQDQKLVNAAAKLEQAFTRLSQKLVLQIGPDVIRFFSDLSSLMALLTGQISSAEFWKERAEHKREALDESQGGDGKPFGTYGPQQPSFGSYGPQLPTSLVTGPDGLQHGGFKGVERLFDMPTGSMTEEQVNAGIHDTAPEKRSFGMKFLNAMGFARGGPKSGMLEPDVEAEVRKASKALGVDSDQAVALFRVEGGGYDRVSSAGAFGPAQLMPATAAELGVPRGTQAKDYDWRTNVDAGVLYLKYKLEDFHGDYDAAEAAYNAGSGRVSDYLSGKTTLPDETKKYVASIHALTRPGVSQVGRQSNDSGNTTIDSDTHVGHINVYTNHNSAPGIVSDIRGALARDPLISKAVTGLN